MSVLVHDPKVFSQIYVKAVDYTFHKTCDINYCSTFGVLKEEYIADVIRTLCDLNCESYEKRYKEEPDKVKLSEFIVFKFTGQTINTFQMLKYLECIYYNIELDTINRPLNELESDSMDCLRNAISEIKSVIIKELPEYQAAKWTE